MKRFCVFAVILVLISACQAVSIPIQPTESNQSLATSTVVISQTAETTLPAVETYPLVENSILSSGPGSQGYEELRELSAGEVVLPEGRFGDFVLVSTLDGLSGYVQSTLLPELPETLDQVSPVDIPWRSLDFFENFYDMKSIVQDGNSITINNPMDGYYDIVGAPYQFNTPFEITVRLTPSPGADGSLKIADHPNIASNEWWKDIRRLNLISSQGKLSITLMDGTAPDSMEYVGLNMPGDSQVTLRFNDPHGKTVTVIDSGGKVVTSIDMQKISRLNLTDGLFPEGNVYIGSVTNPKASLRLDQLALRIPPDGKAQQHVANEPGLKDLAQPFGVTIGSVLDWNHLRDPNYRATFTSNFNLAAISEFSWDGFWLGRGQYDFSLLDQEVDWCLRNGIKVRAMHLVYGATESAIIPAWLRNGEFTKDEYEQILKELIQAIVGRYKGKVTEWSIANESVSRQFYPGSDFWMEHIGPQYIEKAFIWTREVDQEGILILNESNDESRRDNETRRVTDALYATVKDLKSRGVQIDVVGMQMHLLLKYGSPIPPQKADVIATMREFADLGVKIMITELDVDLHGQPGTMDEKYAFQAGLFADMMSACIESNACVSYTTWGVADHTSWITASCEGCINEADADPLMFDRAFLPKPAYFAVRDVLVKARQSSSQ